MEIDGAKIKLAALVIGEDRRAHWNYIECDEDNQHWGQPKIRVPLRKKSKGKKEDQRIYHPTRKLPVRSLSKRFKLIRSPTVE